MAEGRGWCLEGRADDPTNFQKIGSLAGGNFKITYIILNGTGRVKRLGWDRYF